MYKVLVVDDERMIREGLCSLIEWEDYGYVVADTAANGLEAIEKCSQVQPDLVIIDIRMPGMSGLEAIAAMRAQGFKRHVLILSGYADFNYARQALALRMDGYLLKPVDEEELIANLQRLRVELDSDQQRSASAVELEQERCLLACLTGQEVTLALKEEPDWKRYELVLVRLLAHEELEVDAAAAAAFKLELSRLLKQRAIMVLLGSNLVMLVEEGQRGLYELLETAAATGGVEITAVSGGVASCREEVARCYELALQGMRRHFFHPGGRLIAVAEQEEWRGREQEEDGEKPVVEEEELISKLYLALDAGNPEAAYALLKDEGDRVVRSGGGENELKACYMRWMSSVLGKLGQSSVELRQQRYADELLALTKEYRYSRYMERLAMLLSSLCSELDSPASDRQMKKVIDLIKRNYRENLKLETLAELYGYSSAYLGKLFKQTAGESFNSFLDKTRMEQAKALLLKGLKVYEVAEQVGYTHVDYFHSKFKKYVGLSPSEWKNANRTST